MRKTTQLASGKLPSDFFQESEGGQNADNFPQSRSKAVQSQIDARRREAYSDPLLPEVDSILAQQQSARLNG